MSETILAENYPNKNELGEISEYVLSTEGESRLNGSHEWVATSSTKVDISL